jgi:acyl dehydratase
MRILVDSEFRPPAASSVDMLSWPRPVWPGDELHITSELLEGRPSKSRLDRCTVAARTTTFNQYNEAVEIFTAMVILLA